MKTLSLALSLSFLAVPAFAAGGVEAELQGFRKLVGEGRFIRIQRDHADNSMVFYAGHPQSVNFAADHLAVVEALCSLPTVQVADWAVYCVTK